MPHLRHSASRRLFSLGALFVIGIGHLAVVVALNRATWVTSMIQIMPLELQLLSATEENRPRNLPAPTLVPPPEISLNPPAPVLISMESVTAGHVPPRVPPAGLPAVAIPPAAHLPGDRGTTLLALYVLEDGSVADALIVTQSGSVTLDQAAVNWAIAHWRFLPGTEDGRPTAMWLEFPVEWRLASQ